MSGQSPSGASWFWPNVMLALTLLVGLGTVGLCLWRAFR